MALITTMDATMVAWSPAAAATTCCSVGTSTSTCGLRGGRSWKGGVASLSSLKPSPYYSRRRFSSGSIVCETKEAPTGVVDDTSFKTLVIEEKELPVLVDFWAPWCGPCRMLDPVIDSIAEKYKGRIKCFKVNTDECSKTATELGIRSIPTCMIFKMGERLDTVIGCVPETTLTGVIDKYIST